MTDLYSKKENCSGCTACMNICPEKIIFMMSDEEGFLYPHVNQELCVACNLCKKVCPFHAGCTIKENLANPDVYAAKHQSDEVRLSSSSGGMFTAISDTILNKNGTIFGVAFDENMNVCHQKATSAKERNRFKGSKYVQSNLKQTFKEVKAELFEGKYVLFTGTPCQTAGLNNYLVYGKTDINKLYLCDIVCHGTPSPLLWKDHLNFVEKKHCKIEDYYFRYKPKSWRAPSILATFIDGQQKYNSDDLLTFHNLFYLAAANRPSCQNCKFTNLHRPSDITIADFWGIEKCMPLFDDNKGVSLVLINTLKGRQLFDEIKEDLSYRVSNTTDCLQYNLQYPTRGFSKRAQFWEDYFNHGFGYVIKKYTGYGTFARAKSEVKSLIRFILNKIGLLNMVKEVIKR